MLVVIILSGSKTCPNCKGIKLLESFYVIGVLKSGMPKYQSWCKNCIKILSIDRNKVVRKEVQKLKEQPCKDCGVIYPHYVMDYDHLRDKKIPMNRIYSYTKTIRDEESAKCDIVCANCHRIRTWNRLHGETYENTP